MPNRHRTLVRPIGHSTASDNVCDVSTPNVPSLNKQCVPVSSPKQRRGFAVIDPALHRAIASLGGKAAHRVGRAHIFTHEEAQAAGRKRWQTRARVSPSSLIAALRQTVAELQAVILHAGTR